MVKTPRPLRKPVITALEIKRTRKPSFRKPKMSMNSPTRIPRTTR
jgi:hypothetical protein